MKLTVIDTPGFGDQINNENWYMSASEISALNPLLGRREHGADSFMLRTICILHVRQVPRAQAEARFPGEFYPCQPSMESHSKGWGLKENRQIS